MGQIDPVHTQAERLGNGCFCNVQESCALCRDRAPAAGRLADGAHAVVLSAEKGSGYCQFLALRQPGLLLRKHSLQLFILGIV